MEQELLTLPEHLSSPPVFIGVRVTRSLVLYACVVDRFFPFLLFLLAIVLSVLLRNRDPDCPFGIFKLFFLLLIFRFPFNIYDINNIHCDKYRCVCVFVCCKNMSLSVSLCNNSVVQIKVLQWSSNQRFNNDRPNKDFTMIVQINVLQWSSK